ncbi:DUF5305 family protein [Natrinema amylolyticum]|uniref:DUF5305 family protein n=1 Tax=Natrinema amylolyticum TaxID=2878679 RepID=UPI001CFB5800|nr:DUF5305 family protein [Natrinema amylolyticum]
MTLEWLTVAQLRYRKFVGERDRQVVAVSLVLGILLAGGGLATAASPPTETVQQPTDTVVVTTTQTTAATVTGESDMYDHGYVVQNSSLYLTDAAPNFSVTAQVSTADDRHLAVDQRLTLVYEARDGDETFWQRQEVVAQSSDTVNEGGATVTATLNASEILVEQQTLDAETGSGATVRAILVHSASYSTGEYEGEFTNDAAIGVSDQTYSVGDGIANRASHLEQQRVTRSIESEMYGVPLIWATYSVPKQTVWFVLAALVCWLVGGHAILLRSQRASVSDIERELTHRRFDNWMSQARVPDEMVSRCVSVSTLADLVDLAIDIDNRVVYDPNREQYIVLADHMTYIYTPEPTIGDVRDDVEGKSSGEINGPTEESEFEWAEKEAELDKGEEFEWTDDVDTVDNEDEFNWNDTG